MGLVGMGMTAAAACGNIFASPSSGQVVSVSREVERGAGVLLAFGNYTGDMLQFGLAAERLRAEGHDVRIGAVSDDIASAPLAAIDQRRGIAGGLAVYKVAGAAAEAGLGLDAVATNLQARGVRIVDAECGELVTSLEMAGVSLSLFWLDDELEPFWQAPADSAAFHRGEPTPNPTNTPEPETGAAAQTPLAPAPHRGAMPPARGDQLIWARRVLEGLHQAQAALVASQLELGQLDAVAGDGDHGLGKVRGVGGAVAAAQRVVDDQGSAAAAPVPSGALVWRQPAMRSPQQIHWIRKPWLGPSPPPLAPSRLSARPRPATRPWSMP
nr:dihydroxyacetone kinase subunit DhaK [Synechococcus sp. CS-1328]